MLKAASADSSIITKYLCSDFMATAISRVKVVDVIKQTNISPIVVVV